MHKWKIEDDLALKKEATELFTAADSGKLTAGIKLCFAYIHGLPQASQSVWEVPSKEALEKEFEKFPVLKKYTEFVPVVQIYPPTLEYEIALVKQLIKAASK
jgi:hypothetical protein